MTLPPRALLFSPRKIILQAMPYSISVGKPALGAAPEDVASQPHHVKGKDGTTSHFQNPHPSAKKNFTQWNMPFKLIK